MTQACRACTQGLADWMCECDDEGEFPRCDTCDLPENICDCTFCSECHQLAYEYEEATEMCGSCYESAFGEPIPA